MRLRATEDRLIVEAVRTIPARKKSEIIAEPEALEETGESLCVGEVASVGARVQPSCFSRGVRVAFLEFSGVPFDGVPYGLRGEARSLHRNAVLAILEDEED